jgi:hypothetical protein
MMMMMKMLLLHLLRTRRPCRHTFPIVHFLSIVMELDGAGSVDGAIVRWYWCVGQDMGAEVLGRGGEYLTPAPACVQL